MWIDDGINIEPFFSITPVGRVWLVKTYQYGCHPSVLSHHALGTAECDESYYIEGDHILSFFRRGAGFFFTMSHTATRASSWPYMDFWKFNYFVTSDESGGAMPLYGKWEYPWPYMVTPQRRGFLGCIKLNTPYYSYIPNLCLKLSGYIYTAKRKKHDKTRAI